MSSSFAYDVATHEEITKRSVDRSSLNAVLAELGFRPGGKFALADRQLTARQNDGTAKGWLAEGSNLEDDELPIARPLNHFYNPLPGVPNRGGLTVASVGIGYASPDWGLEDAAGLDTLQEFSLKDARQYLVEAMVTRELPWTEREKKFALAFRSLGQVVHLVQDTAQPQHARNDRHLHEDGGFTSWYERYTDAQRRDNRLNYAGYAPVSLPLARSYWAAEISDPATDLELGLAQYSNRNFVSRDTNFQGTFAAPLPAEGFPRPDPRAGFPEYISAGDPEIAQCAPTENLTGAVVFIRTLVDDQYTGEAPVPARTSTLSVFDPHLRDAGHPPVFGLNRCTMDAAHTFLIPRAVGYSAGFIDHFFRGRLEVTPPAQFAYGIAETFGDARFFTKLRFKLRKSAPTNESAGTGTVWAVVRYRPPADGMTSLIENPLKVFTSTPALENLVPPLFAVSAPQTVSVTETAQEVTFDFGADPIPANSADLYLTVLYRGPLGLEQDAVMIGGKNLSEPTPIDLANISDYDCFQSQLWPVTETQTAAQRDIDGDGDTDVNGPLEIHGVIEKSYNQLAVPPSPSLGLFDYRLPSTDPLRKATFTRYLVLVEPGAFGVAIRKEIEVDTYLQQQIAFDLVERVLGVKATLNGFDAQGIYQIDLPGRYRGKIGFQTLLYGTQALRNCLAQGVVNTSTLTPDIVEIGGIVNTN
jgi:hypothetical protein